jgi:hypothetical protein
MPTAMPQIVPGPWGPNLCLQIQMNHMMNPVPVHKSMHNHCFLKVEDGIKHYQRILSTFHCEAVDLKDVRAKVRCFMPFSKRKASVVHNFPT